MHWATSQEKSQACLRGSMIGHAHAEAVDEVGGLERLHRADLHALAALDAGGEEVVLVERAGRPQPLLLAQGSGR